MQAEWESDELINAWTLSGSDWDLIANKAGVTRLGFAVMLKFYEIEGRFPVYPEEVPPAAVSYVGSLVKVDPALFAKYSWAGRSIKYHRSQIRKVYEPCQPPPASSTGQHHPPAKPSQAPIPGKRPPRPRTSERPANPRTRRDTRAIIMPARREISLQDHLLSRGQHLALYSWIRV